MLVAVAGATYAQLVFDLPVRQEFTYRIPEPLLERVRPGVLCVAPFGPRKLVGVCVGLASSTALPRTRAIIDCLDEAVIPAVLLDLARFVSGYYGCSMGEAIHAGIPLGVRRGRGKEADEVVCRLISGGASMEGARKFLRRSPRAVEALEILSAHGSEMPVSELCEAMGGGKKSVLSSLARHGLVEMAPAKLPDVLAPPEPEASRPTLTSGQADAFRQIDEALCAATFRTFLLHGVTGSGKTEVYLRAVERVLERGLRAMVLVPEIALTPQLLRQFRQRVPDVVVLHSLQRERDRRLAWQACKNGSARVVIGPRSVLFAPLEKVGLIVVDEEHETSYKQQEPAPRYQARDLAVYRARAEGAVCILGSATPSAESVENASRGRYTKLVIRERATGALLPDVHIVDMADEIREAKGRLPLLSRSLHNALAEALNRGEQAILFLNRRGYSTCVTCPLCGFTLRCASCDICLTYHRARRMAICHYCGEGAEPPARCDSCQGPLDYKGVGTEKAERVIGALFPGYEVARFDSDTVQSVDELHRRFENLASGRTRILVGTQMVAKGLDIPGVTVVGVLNADLSLQMPDFRAAERTFQLLAQVTGRAGRAQRKGSTYIQTFQPFHPVVRAAASHDFDGFMQRELLDRKKHGYPPHSRLVRLLLTGEEEEAVGAIAKSVAERLRASNVSAQILGPAPCPISFLRKRHRWHILCKAPDVRSVAQCRNAVEGIRLPAGLRLAVDVDPVSML